MGERPKRNMKDFYAYVSSAPTKKHPENTFTDFRITLPHELDLKQGEWSVGICDLAFKQPMKVLPQFHICCDLIEVNFDSTSSQPILKFVHSQESNVKESFTNVFYCRLKSNILDSFHLYLKPAGETLPSVTDTVFFCTLHFKNHG